MLQIFLLFLFLFLLFLFFLIFLLEFVVLKWIVDENGINMQQIYQKQEMRYQNANF